MLNWFKPRTKSLMSHFDGVLGTSLDLQLLGSSGTNLTKIEDAILAEIDRLDRCLSRYDPESEFSHWRCTKGEWVEASKELRFLLLEAEYWQKHTGNAFHAAAESVVRAGGDPDQALWEVSGTRIRKLTDLDLSLDSIAKGYIIDRCAETAIREGATSVVVNIGGDIRHIGPEPLVVAISDPRHDAENAAPLEEVTIKNGAIATSGDYRRTVQWNDQEVSHIFDVRTLEPAQQCPSATFIASCALVADVMSTAASVMEPDDLIALTESIEDSAFLLVRADNERFESSSWYSFRVGNCHGL